MDGLLHEVKLFDLSSVTKKSVGKAILSRRFSLAIELTMKYCRAITEVCDGEEINGLPIFQVVGPNFIWKLKAVERVQLLGPVGEVWGVGSSSE